MTDFFCHTWYCRQIIAEEDSSKHICMAYPQGAQKNDILNEVSFWVISSYRVSTLLQL
jgi:hypothetical protein